jgi:hypothetical protein
VTRFRAVAFVSLLVAAASVSVAGLSFAAGPADMRLRDLAGVNFVSACGFSHRAPADPIVFPGQPGRSHDHSFVGNTSTNAFSTLRSLLRGSSTCERPGDTAAYWMPTLLVGGRMVMPRGATIYYRRRTLDPVRAFPPGFKMVAGDARAAAPQSMRVTYWNCGAMSGVPPSASVPTCPDDRRAALRLHVTFPSCWSGAALDSADHQSHMAYPRGGRCPMSHPVAVPTISLIYRYPVTGGPDATLASGGQFSGHADFFNACNQEALTALVDGCLNALRHCQRGT